MTTLDQMWWSEEETSPIPVQAARKRRRPKGVKFKELIPPRTLRLLKLSFAKEGVQWNSVRDFFELYQDLYIESLKPGIPEWVDFDPRTEYKSAANGLLRSGFSPEVATLIRNGKGLMSRSFPKLGVMAKAWTRMADEYAEIIIEVAREREVFLYKKPLMTKKGDKWFSIWKFTPKQEVVQRLKKSNPDAYAAIMLKKKSFKTLTNLVKSKISDAGMDYKLRRSYGGQLIHIGIDRISGDNFVYDLNGDITPQDEWTVNKKAEAKVNKAAARFTLPAEELEDLREASDEEIESLGGQLTYATISDSLAAKEKMARMYPVKQVWRKGDGWSTERPPEAKPDSKPTTLIVGGKFKGILLDSVVNEAGHLLEGTSLYEFNPKTGRSSKRGKLAIASSEPYVTVAEDGRLFIKVPQRRNHAVDKNRKQNLLDESANNPTVEAVAHTRRTEFYFEPKDFAAIRDAVGEMYMSKAVLDKIQQYYEDLARDERATEDQFLGSFDKDNLGGFKEDGWPLYKKQKKALAWMESRGNSGVCALDTGTGKTITAIAMMQKLVRDGYTDAEATNTITDPLTKETKTFPSNGRFLFCCPEALMGNIQQEMHETLKNSGAFIDQNLDVMSFKMLSRARKSGKYPLKMKKLAGEPFVPEEYIAIFFDEIHLVVKRDSLSKPVAKAIFSINHPRKICLTASPMDQDPTDAYILAAVANNIDLSLPSRRRTDPGFQNRKAMNSFKKRFTEVVGGRVVGVKQKPGVKRDLMTWVKRNIFFADKQDIEEYTLPNLTVQTEVLKMEPKVERAYRKVSQEATAELAVLTEKFSDWDTFTRDKSGALISDNPDVDTPRMDRVKGREFAKVLKRLENLQNFPDEPAPIGLGLTRRGKPFNPKISRATEIVKDAMKTDVRSLLFSDDPKMVSKTAQGLSSKAGGFHVAALQKEIRVYRSGKVVSEFEGYTMPFKPADAPKTWPDGKPLGADEWHTFFFKSVAMPNPNVKTMSLHGTTYSTGQNFQPFGNVVHMDRDSWSSESMKQRTARSWRRGQKNPVSEHTLDMAFSNPTANNDRTLDQLRNMQQTMSADLFGAMIHQAQSKVLGQEWDKEMKLLDAKLMKEGERADELANLVKEMMNAMSPYIANTEMPQSSRDAARTVL